MEKKVLKDRIDVVIVIILMFSINLLFNYITLDLVGDELWNFQNLYKIHNGYAMYIDANIIVTPLFFYIGRLFLFIFGNNIFAFNIYGAIINAMLLTTLYLIFRNFEMDKKYSLIAMLLIYCEAYHCFIGRSANYNILAIAWVLISILIAVKNNKQAIKMYDLKQGILCFLVLFTKQNTGVYYLVGLTIARIIINSNKKTEMKNLLKMYCTILVLGMIFLVYLIKSNTIEGFFYYVVSGTGEFLSNLFVYKEFFFSANFESVVFLCILGYIIGVMKLRNTIDEKERKNIKLLLIISIPMMLIAFPLFEDYHIMNGMFCSIIYSVYVIQLYLKKFKMKKEKVILAIIYLFIIAYLALTCMNDIKTYVVADEYMRVNEKGNPFYNALFSKYWYKEMNIIQDYIIKKQTEGINVIVIDTSSSLYMVPLNKSNGKFDCFNTGNLGKYGAQGAIEEIKQMKNTEILIQANYTQDKGDQQPQKVNDYIKENLEYKGEIEIFSIYATKMEGE